MRISYLYLSIFLTLMLISGKLCQYFAGIPELTPLFLSSDSESCWARGELAPLETIPTHKLELLPGVSTSLADSIVEAREKILSAANEMPADERAAALEHAKGIGPKSALKISRFLGLGMKSRDGWTDR